MRRGQSRPDGGCSTPRTHTILSSHWTRSTRSTPASWKASRSTPPACSWTPTHCADWTRCTRWSCTSAARHSMTRRPVRSIAGASASRWPRSPCRPTGSSAITREVLGRAFEDALLGTAGTKTQCAVALSSPRNARVTARPASLLAHALGLGGGSCTLDAACASSLCAVKLACDELRAGRTDAMLAGGVSRPESLYTQMGFCQLRALSPSGVCRPFRRWRRWTRGRRGCGHRGAQAPGRRPS